MKTSISSFALFALLLVLVLFIAQCNKPSAYNKFQDPELIRLAEFTDRRNTDSVLQFLTSKQPLLRVEAAFSLASMRDPKAINALHSSILDPVAEVRAAAAYALGQTLHPSSIESLSLQLRYEGNAAAFIAMAEAIGKIGGGLHASQTAPEFVENAANAIFNIERTDSIGINAIAKATFWMHNGGWGETHLMNKLAAFYAEQSIVNRRMIAYAIGRYRGDWYLDTLQANAFIHKLSNETDTLARVAAIAAVGRTKSYRAGQLLKEILANNRSGQEQLVAALRASGKHPYVDAQPLLSLIEYKQTVVAEEACLSLQNKKLSFNQVKELKATLPALEKVLQASTVRLLHLQGDTLNVNEWLTAIDGTMKPYERLACIRTLGVSGSSAEVTLKRALSNPDLLQANAYTEAFIESHSQANFPTNINYSKALTQLLERGDIGITALCAAALREVDTTQLDLNDLNQTMLNVLSTLQLPKEIETANEIIKTLNIWAISPRQEIKAEYNNPIDWNLVKSIPRRQRANIHTSKGVIEIELHIEDAPGSVASFVKLCREGFYNGKSFHRVVPNFVIQGGCPRGDGMGGTDYTLRSEFRLHDYRSGSVGLASSGPDTESCQWFITHIPAPHLEGRYTIFAHVTKGLDIVDQIVIGDSIEKIELLED